jgi:hypothetical protein
MIYLLLVLFQLKHFFCDYPLQTPYMLGKFKGGREWILPLSAHALVHLVGTWIIASFYLIVTGKLHDHQLLPIGLGLLDFVLHFAMDRIKASPNLLGRYKSLDANCYPGVAQMAEGNMPVAVIGEEYKQKVTWARQRLKENTYFWWALGLDQGVHHLTHYLIIGILLS